MSPDQDNCLSSRIQIELRELAGETAYTVDARQLWEFLEVGRDFTSWMKDRIEKYAFTQGVDFEVFTGIGENPNGGRPQSIYVISLDMAKELAIVENNDKGKEARRHFIDCERRAMSKPVMDVSKLLNDPAALLTLLGGYCERELSLKSKVATIAELQNEEGNV